jgi:hypothetical protein
VALLLMPLRVARGDEIRDGDEYSVTLPQGVRACVVYPKYLFDPAACPSDEHPLEENPVSPATAVAVGSVIVDGHKVSLAAFRVVADQTLHGPVDVEGFARSMAEGMKKNQPSVRLEGEPGARRIEIGGLPVGRITFDLEGMLGRSHQINFVAWAEDGTYVLSWTGLASSAPAIDAMADQTASTLRLAHPATESPAYLFGYVLGRVSVPTVVVIVFVVWWRKSRRKKPGASQSAPHGRQ